MCSINVDHPTAACWKETMKRMNTMKPKQLQQQQQHFFWRRGDMCKNVQDWAETLLEV